MKKSRMAVSFLSAAVAVSISGRVLGGEPEKAPAGAEVGKPAPAFTLKNHDGKDVSLKDYKDKIVVLEWFNADCPYIVARHSKGRDINAEVMKQFAGKPVVWLSIDSTAAHAADFNKKIATDWKISYPILSDKDGTVGKAYGASSTPHMFVIDQKGNLAYKGALDDDPDGEKGANAKNYVAEAVKSLLSNSTVATASTKSYGCSVKYAAK